MMEQPTLFYAIALTLVFLGQRDGMNPMLAWLYVALRLIHSLHQVLFNHIQVRFAVIVLSSLVLFALSGSAVAALI